MNRSTITRLTTLAAAGALVAGAGSAYAMSASAVPSSSTPAAVAKAAPAKAATVAAHPLSRVTFVELCGAEGVRSPRTVPLACADGNADLTQLRWSGWGAKTARATGVAVVNSCVPDCARGTDRRYPVKVTATRLSHREATQVYTRVTATFTKKVPAGFDRTETIRLPR